MADDEAMRQVDEAAERWGARFTRHGAGGTLRLPVLAGLRDGWVEGPVWTEPDAAGAVLVFKVERSSYRLRPLPVAVLASAALGAGVVVIAPLVPALIPAMPLGAMLAVGAWFFVVARLRNSGPEEFLREIGTGAS